MEGIERVLFFQNEKQKDFYLLGKSKKCWCNGEIKKEMSKEVVVRIKSQKR